MGLQAMVGGGEPGSGGGGPGGSSPARDGGTPRDAEWRRTLLLKLNEPVGSVGYKDTPISDFKWAEKDGYKYSGARNGVAWKREVETHFISVAPALQEVLKLAGGEDLHLITRGRFVAVVGSPASRLSL